MNISIILDTVYHYCYENDQSFENILDIRRSSDNGKSIADDLYHNDTNDRSRDHLSFTAEKAGPADNCCAKLGLITLSLAAFTIPASPASAPHIA